MAKESQGSGPAPDAGDARRTKIAVRYDEMMARYANQVALRTSAEEVYLEFCSGIVPDPATGQPVFPVHTRIAMTHGGARRLAELLTQALSRPQPAEGVVQTGPAEGDRASGFPPLAK